MSQAPLPLAGNGMDEAARRLEDLWRRGCGPDVGEFVSAAGPLSPAQLVEVLCVDQWQRWHRGERPAAEEYLARHPRIEAAPEEAFDLVYGEFLLLEELGEGASLPDFVRRFPQHAVQLERQVKLHAAVELDSPSWGTHGPRSLAAVSPPPGPADPKDWPVIPGYIILAELGHGAMGRVFKAQHQRLDRLVALKVIRPEWRCQNPDAVQRFEREARAAAQLSHPNIIAVYDCDQAGDTHFIAMEYVEGTDLHRLVQDWGPLPIPLAAEFVRQVALGLQHAHEHGLVHRDVKPSNLMAAVPQMDVGMSGFAVHRSLRKLLLGAVIKVLDLGMARLAHSTGPHLATQEGTLMGTPDFLSPEQALNSRAVDGRSDLYSLGCTLYYLLAGRPPYADCSLVQKLLMHQMGRPQPIRRLRADVSDKLTGILERLLARDPDDRFQSAAELAEALSGCLPGQLSPSRLGDWPPRGAPATASTRLAPESSQQANGITAPPAEKATSIAVLKGRPSSVLAMAFAPNRQFLATGTVHGAVRLWDLSGSQPVEKAVLQTNLTEVHSLSFTADSRTLAAGSGSLDGLIWLWDLDDLKQKALLAGHEAAVEALAFSPDGSALATASMDRTIHLWDLSDPTPKERAVFKGHEGPVKSVAVAPDNKMVISGSLDGTVRFWAKGGLWSKSQLGVVKGDWGNVHTVALSPDAGWLAFGCLDQAVHLWQLEGPRVREITLLHGHPGVVQLVQFTPDGDKLVSVCDAGRVIEWDLASTSQSRARILPAARVSSVAFTSDGRYLAAGSSNGAISLFRLFART